MTSGGAGSVVFRRTEAPDFDPRLLAGESRLSWGHGEAGRSALRPDSPQLGGDVLRHLEVLQHDRKRILRERFQVSVLPRSDLIREQLRRPLVILQLACDIGSVEAVAAQLPEIFAHESMLLVQVRGQRELIFRG